MYICIGLVSNNYIMVGSMKLEKTIRPGSLHSFSCPPFLRIRAVWVVGWGWAHKANDKVNGHQYCHIYYTYNGHPFNTSFHIISTAPRRLDVLITRDQCLPIMAGWVFQWKFFNRGIKVEKNRCGCKNKNGIKNNLRIMKVG